jgi:predicted HicB family RNase H-like nuclease
MSYYRERQEGIKRDKNINVRVVKETHTLIKKLAKRNKVGMATIAETALNDLLLKEGLL